MREATISTGKKFQIHPLKGKDVREVSSLPKTEDWMVVFETLRRAGFKDEELDEMIFPDILELNKAVIAETYGIEIEEKN